MAGAIGEWTAHVAAARAGNADWMRAGLQFIVGRLTGEFSRPLRLLNCQLPRRRCAWNLLFPLALVDAVNKKGVLTCSGH